MPPRGDNYERELEARLWKEGFASFRVAGSGTVSHASADLVAIKDGDAVILDSKSIGNLPVDLSDSSGQLKELYQRSGIMCYYALKFKSEMGGAWRYAPFTETHISDPDAYNPMYKLLNRLGDEE